jgi:hypothetical protein
VEKYFHPWEGPTARCPTPVEFWTFVAEMDFGPVDTFQQIAMPSSAADQERFLISGVSIQRAVLHEKLVLE